MSKNTYLESGSKCLRPIRNLEPAGIKAGSHFAFHGVPGIGALQPAAVVSAFLVILIFASEGDAGGTPHLGQFFSDKATKDLIQTAPARFRRHFVLETDIKWDLGVGEDGTIRFIRTEDPRFQTREGFSVHSQYSEVRRRTGKEAVPYSDWGYAVDLPSGWKAVFRIKSSSAIASVPDATEISFFYQGSDGWTKERPRASNGYYRGYLDQYASSQLPDGANETVSVIGMVEKPNTVVQPRSGLTLTQALDEAGGFAPFGDHQHVGIWRSEEGRFLTVNVDAIRRKELSDLVLLKGDIVVIVERVM